MPTFTTIAAPLRYEIEKIKGSRFIADAHPISNQTDAEAALRSVREAFPDASHHCWAWLLSDDRERSSDDGEPAGTAGKPIMNHLRGSGLVGVLIVVTRYFGGTKLGTGGLIRAYGAAAKAVLEQVEHITFEERATLSFTFPYELTAAVQSVLAAHHAEEISADYGERVEMTISVLVEERDAFSQAIGDASAGTITPRLHSSE